MFSEEMKNFMLVLEMNRKKLKIVEFCPNCGSDEIEEHLEKRAKYYSCLKCKAKFKVSFRKKEE